MAAPVLPPVDPETQARARAILAQQSAPAPAAVQYYPPVTTPAPAATIEYYPPTATPAPVSQPLAGGFIAPAPVMSIPNPLPAPVAAPAPRVAVVAPTPMPVTAAPAVMAPPVVAAPRTELTDQSRQILSHVPSSLDKPVPAGKPIALDRVTPEIKEVLGQKAKEETYESVGLSIKVRRPGLDTNYELNRAYNQLMGGDTTAAIETYKNILGQDPQNEDALFGLASTYHKLGMIDQARPLYGMLLKIDPNNREGLNNFLVLVSDESPADALPELQRLEERNPEFSPIPAQTALVLEKLGYPDQAREKMLRAIELAPENLSYKYNLAVMLDRQGRMGDAAALYKALIQASLQGMKVPASTEAMQKRLTYLVTEMTAARTAAMNGMIRQN